MGTQMSEHANTFHYYDYLFIDNPDGISAWSNLFAEVPKIQCLCISHGLLFLKF